MPDGSAANNRAITPISHPAGTINRRMAGWTSTDRGCHYRRMRGIHRHWHRPPGNRNVGHWRITDHARRKEPVPERTEKRALARQPGIGAPHRIPSPARTIAVVTITVKSSPGQAASVAAVAVIPARQSGSGAGITRRRCVLVPHLAPRIKIVRAVLLLRVELFWLEFGIENRLVILAETNRPLTQRNFGLAYDHARHRRIRGAKAVQTGLQEFSRRIMIENLNVIVFCQLVRLDKDLAFGHLNRSFGERR